MAYKKILVTLDGSSLSESVLPHAQAMGRQFSGEVILLQVVAESDSTLGDFDKGESCEKAHRYLTEKASVLDRLFYGSVTDRVLRSATHPMLVIRPEST